MKVIHLTDSPFFGGPERQMIGLIRALPSSYESRVVCFRNRRDTARSFVSELRAAGIEACTLDAQNPRFIRTVREIASELTSFGADLLVCHGYKADILGWLAARLARVPCIAVSRGWTGHTSKVRFNDAIDKWFLRWMQLVVCVSEGQARKVQRAGVRPEQIRVIHNAIDTRRFDRETAVVNPLRSLFRSPPDYIILAAGRLSPEKGFDVLVNAARLVVQSCNAGFIVFGDGPERALLENQINAAGLREIVLLPGFHADLDSVLPHADLFLQSSHTEGLPNVLLEACAARVPVVATNVGGTAELIRDGVNGTLIPPADATAIADAITELLRAPEMRRWMGGRGRDIVTQHFSFAGQSSAYDSLLQSIVSDLREPTYATA